MPHLFRPALAAASALVAVIVAGPAPAQPNPPMQAAPLALRADSGWTGLRITLRDGRQMTVARGDIARVDYLSPAPPPPPVSTASPVGTWAWVQGQQLVIQANGTCLVFLNGAQINSCSWTSLGGGRFRFTHRNGGYVDTVTISADGNTLSGVNNSGYALHGTRTRATPPTPQAGIAGRWSWVSGQVLVIASGGTCQVFLNGRQINACTWTSLGNGRYRLTHRSGGYVDTVTLSADGRRLDGVNNSNYPLHGTRQ